MLLKIAVDGRLTEDLQPEPGGTTWVPKRIVYFVLDMLFTDLFDICSLQPYAAIVAFNCNDESKLKNMPSEAGQQGTNRRWAHTM